MTPERWAEIEELFHRVTGCEPDERVRLLNEAGSTDPDLRREVESLLACQVSAGEHLRAAVRGAVDSINSSGAGEIATPESANNSPASPADNSGITADASVEFRFPAGRGNSQPQSIGVYRLLEKIGEGGMGEVWLAEQKEPVRRRVALKLVKAGMNSREVMARFESERQALALMDHPAIAKVLDAGSTPQGAPYFVMEYVAGVPMTDYCDRHRLSTRERLELFGHVCEGVQHAHQKAIIHRDLKPSNILVSEVDGRAAPKIIDFGVAKALTQKLTLDTLYTRAGTLVGTPEYMSPEQANSAGEDIDTRTDVYSLGVIFYELLAGTPPLDMKTSSLDEFLRRLREEEPPKPSTRIRTLAPATATELARKRQTEPMALAKQLGGDLDSIALKALEKDRTRRYASVAGLAADIRRHLRDEPIMARPPSASYQLQKFARRHQALVLGVAAVFVVLVLGVVASTWEAVQARRAEAKAKEQSAIAQAVNDFLQHDLLAQASAAVQSGPTTKPDPDMKVRTALDRAAARIGGKFARQPEVEAAIRDTMGQTYRDLGLYPEARQQLERALDLHRRTLGEMNPKTLKTMSSLGRTAELQGKYSDAEALLGQALAAQRRLLGAEHPDTLYSMNNLAAVYWYQGNYPHAEALDSETLEIRRRALGPEHPDTLISMANLAVDYVTQGKYPEAELLDSQVLEIQRRVVGPEHPETLQCMNNLALVYLRQGKYPQAEVLLTQTLEIERRVLGSEHPFTLNSMGNLALVYDGQGNFPQAKALYSQTLEIQRRVLGPQHPGTLRSMNNLAGVYVAQGKFAQAEALFSQTLEIRRRVLGLEHLDTLDSMNGLADTYSAQGKYDPAETLFKQTLGIDRRLLGSEHPFTLALLSDFAFMYQQQGKYTLTETYASQALAGRRHALGSEHPDTMASAASLALAYLSQGKFAEGEPLAREAVEVDQKNRPDDWQRFRAESLLGASLAGEKKYAEAEPLLLEGYQGMLARKDRIAVPDRYHLELAHDWIVQLYKAWGKPNKAAEWRKK